MNKELWVGDEMRVDISRRGVDQSLLVEKVQTTIYLIPSGRKSTNVLEAVQCGASLVDCRGQSMTR